MLKRKQLDGGGKTIVQSRMQVTAKEKEFISPPPTQHPEHTRDYRGHFKYEKALGSAARK